MASYGAIAKAAGGSPRAVGNVMCRKLFAPIALCHMVVSSEFTLGGYGGGLSVKHDFLVREKQGYASRRHIPIGDKELQVLSVEFVLKNSK